MGGAELYVDINNMCKIQFHEFIKLYNEIPFLNKQFDFKEDFKKEIEFNDIKEKQLLFGVQIEYADNSGIKREEVWKTTNGEIICYEYTNTGYRGLTIENLDDQVIDEIKKNAYFIKRMGNQVKEYVSIEQRDLIK